MARKSKQGVRKRFLLVEAKVHKGVLPRHRRVPGGKGRAWAGDVFATTRSAAIKMVHKKHGKGKFAVVGRGVKHPKGPLVVRAW